MNRRLWRGALILLGLPVLALALAIGVGLVLPEAHEVTSRARYSRSPDSLWADVSDPARAATWRPDIQRVEILPDRDGRAVWREVGPTGELTYERVEFEPPRRMAVQIAEPDLPFSGLWIYEVSPVEGGAVLTLTERGEVYNPLFRFMARYLFGYHSTLDSYLTALGAKYGEETVPRHDPEGTE
jgi:uncharacterized protein YndB with AHSA1/START domain